MDKQVSLPRVDLAAQNRAFKDDILDAVGRIIESGNYILGEEVRAFERDFSDYLGSGEVVAVSDGTAAIVLALKSLGVGPGDQVITTPFTAVPTIGAILEVGATPVFADIDARTWLIDPDRVVEKVGPATKAVIAVHMFGNVVDIEHLQSVLPDGVVVIEDAAQAHGASIRGTKAGCLAGIGTFSFYPTKNLGACGDGGAVVVRSPGQAEQIRLLRNHGLIDRTDYVVPGRNSRLDDIQAAILRVKLGHLDDMNARREALCGRYRRLLSDAPVSFQYIDKDVRSNHHLIQVRYEGPRDRVVATMMSRGIGVDAFYRIPHYRQPALAFLKVDPRDLPETEKLCAQAIALPLYPEMPIDHVDIVCEALIDAIEGVGE